MSKRRCTALLTLLTFWPPGPLARIAEISSLQSAGVQSRCMTPTEPDDRRASAQRLDVHRHAPGHRAHQLVADRAGRAANLVDRQHRATSSGPTASTSLPMPSLRKAPLRSTATMSIDTRTDRRAAPAARPAPACPRTA